MSQRGAVNRSLRVDSTIIAANLIWSNRINSRSLEPIPALADAAEQVRGGLALDGDDVVGASDSVIARRDGSRDGAGESVRSLFSTVDDDGGVSCH